MKRLFVLFAFLLVSCAAFAQDEKPQSEGTLLIVPRLDADPAYSFADKAWSFDFGSSSLYTVFDGNLGDHLSFSISNHWIAFADSFDNTKDLYRNTWRSDVNNWVDWANVTASFGSFSLTLGKDYIHFGTYEIDDYDFDAHKQLVPMQPGDVPTTYADASALERDFGFTPKITLREGLRHFAEWYKEYYCDK